MLPIIATMNINAKPTYIDDKISDANKKLDAKNELWHAVRIGMITAANYKTITGEDYPNIPPTRVETKAAL